MLKIFTKKLKSLYIYEFMCLFFMKGKTIIHFKQHGCMSSTHEFDWIGAIIGATYPIYCGGKNVLQG